MAERKRKIDFQIKWEKFRQDRLAVIAAYCKIKKQLSYKKLVTTLMVRNAAVMLCWKAYKEKVDFKFRNNRF